MDKSNNPIPSPSPTILSALYLYCFFFSPSPSPPTFCPFIFPPSLSPSHLVFTGLKKACQLALRAHECTIHICAPNVDLCSGVVVKEVTCFHLSAVPLMEQLAQVVVLLHPQLTREHMCHTHITSHHMLTPCMCCI